MIIKTILSVIFISIFLAPQSIAQTNDYVLQQWKVENGLPQSTVRCITQTRDGYLWAGTWQGLARFDGVRMTIFKASNTPSLHSPNIMSLFTDSRGQLWIGTDQGGLVRYSQGTFKRFDSTDGCSATRILHINEDRSGRIWFATEIGIFSYDGKKFLHFTEANGLPHTYANQAMPMPDGKMYLGFVGYGSIAHLEGDSLKVDESFQVGGYAVTVDSTGTICFGFRGKGFVRRNNGKEIIDGRYASLQTGETYILRNGELWLLTTNDIRAINGSRSLTMKQIDDVTFSEITTVYEDREGNIWLGKEGGGLICLRKKQLTVLSKRSGFQSDLINCGVQDNENSVWIGTWDSGLLLRQDSSNQKFASIPLPKPAASVFTIEQSQSEKGKLWVGTWGAGVYSVMKNQVQRFSKGILRDPLSIISIREDLQGGLWVGTAHNGVAYYPDYRKSDEEILWNTESGLSGNRVNSLLAARNGDMWISLSANGVNRISKGELTVFKKGNGLNDNFASPMYEDSDGAIWIGTTRGLNRWKPARRDVPGGNGTFSAVTEAEGLFDENIAQIIEDDTGNFWIGAIHGIYRVSKQELNHAADGKIHSVHCFTIGAEDGMLNEETGGGGTPRCWKTSDGKLWFSTSQGVVIIDPRVIASTAVPPNVIIEDAWIENNPVPMQSKIVLQPGESKLELRYTGINFSAPSKIRFKYYLEGLEKKWNDAGTRRFAQYTNLDPGEYHFHLMGENNAGIMSTQEALLTIVVLPPFYATWWFRTMMILFFLTIGPAIYFMRVRQLMSEQEKQVEFSRRLIESQESERKRIATELHDGLGQNLLIIKNKLLVALQAMNKEAHTNQHVEEASEVVTNTIEEVRSISHNLRPHQLDQLGITKTLRSIIRQLKESTSIEVTAEIDDIDGVLSPEQEISLFRILQETFNNIIKHSGATSVNVELKRTAVELRMIVRDNGVGINEGNERKLGFGMSSMQERGRILGGTIEIISHKGEGTTVRLIVLLTSLAKVCCLVLLNEKK